VTLIEFRRTNLRPQTIFYGILLANQSSLITSEGASSNSSWYYQQLIPVLHCARSRHRCKLETHGAPFRPAVGRLRCPSAPPSCCIFRCAQNKGYSRLPQASRPPPLYHILKMCSLILNKNDAINIRTPCLQPTSQSFQGSLSWRKHLLTADLPLNTFFVILITPCSNTVTP